jgi:hypothetical protein
VAHIWRTIAQTELNGGAPFLVGLARRGHGRQHELKTSRRTNRQLKHTTIVDPHHCFSVGVGTETALAPLVGRGSQSALHRVLVHVAFVTKDRRRSWAQLRRIGPTSRTNREKWGTPVEFRCEHPPNLRRSKRIHPVE